MIKTILIIMILQLISCGNQGKKKSPIVIETKNKKQIEEVVTNKVLDKNFESFLSGLESLKLPHQFTCFDFSNWKLIDELSKNIVISYGEEWDIPFKRILTTNKFETVVFLAPADIHIPVIRTFSLKGIRISELQLFTSCSQEPGFQAKQFVTIKPNLEIVKIDSTWRWEINEEFIEIDSTEKLTVVKILFRIDENGKIYEQ